ncbi:hypothetical protein I204_05984 [Kwoniella mangroviensis CBS 8886]|uniref:uncharacterized protein n=1 Tax=Kwoniella mangroviensis CBS 8507 TaxID=1296122 RepID=UPI00080D373F|nr:uncharacterized protein I203_03206 [Kwoniella mangroviensis CBS 8507]OCF67509.1 hypothetical protein I203_03206 [Kwoniella mangroviensis CBS 8507]OCF72755.1 hypothetical protein I204_05984 [Kwoniella mangroviensis CBS 8886]
MASLTRGLRVAARASALPARNPRITASVSRRRNIIAGSSSITARRGYATSSGEATTVDPAFTKALDLLEAGTRALEDGDLSKAAKLYRESVEAKETSEGWHNLGNCEYHLQNKVAAVEAWGKSIELQPSADAHTNLASAYVLDNPPKPALAIKHLTSALELSPEDPEIAFNLAAVLESTGQLEPSLTLYKKAQSGGIERAAQNVRNVSAKLIGERAKAQEKDKGNQQ